MLRIWLAATAAMCVVAQASAQEFDRPYWLERSVIEAVGRSQVEVAADTASFSVTFREIDQNSRDAMFAASDRARLATEAMRSRGGDAVQITSSADIEAIHQEYRNRDGERMSSERDDQIVNYSVSVTLNVVVRDVRRAALVRAAAMAVGPEDTSDLEFSLDENAPARTRAYRAAVQDAAARARIAAEASNAALGGLLVLQEGQGPCLGRWIAGPARNRDGVQNSVNPIMEDGGGEIVVTGTRARTLRLTSEDIARMQLPGDVPPLQLTAQVCAIYGVG